MPNSSQLIQFKYGLQLSYEGMSSKDPNTIYYCTDTRRLYIGDSLICDISQLPQASSDNNIMISQGGSWIPTPINNGVGQQSVRTVAFGDGLPDVSSIPVGSMFGVW